MSQKQINTRKENSKSKGKKNEDRGHYSKTQKVIGD